MFFMATEREYREWKKRQKRRDSKPNAKNITSTLWIFIIFISMALTIKNNPDFFYSLSTNSLKRLTKEFVTEVDEPVIINQPVSLNNRKFTAIDNKAKSISYTGNSVQELAKLLSQYATNDLEKARIIYTWITYNISYDVPGANDLFSQNIQPDVTTKNVLTTRSTICSGYANLYQQLAQYMGLKSVIVIGYAKSENYIVGADTNVNHGWNAVKIDNEWYLIDTTWGAGTVNNDQFNPSFNPYYFGPPPSQLIYTHFPEDEKWQLLNPPISRSQFDNFPDVSSELFQYNIQLVNYQTSVINANDRLNISLKAPKNVVAIANLKNEQNEVLENYTFIQKQGEYININVGFPKAGNYELEIFAKPKDDNNSYPFVVRYDITSNNSTGEFPSIFEHFSVYNGYLETPVKKKLTPNQTEYFKLKIDNAQEVKILNKSSNQWQDLTRYGNVFAGNVNVGDGNVIIYGKFPGDSRYWGLIDYSE